MACDVTAELALDAHFDQARTEPGTGVARRAGRTSLNPDHPHRISICQGNFDSAFLAANCTIFARIGREFMEHQCEGRCRTVIDGNVIAGN